MLLVLHRPMTTALARILLLRVKLAILFAHFIELSTIHAFSDSTILYIHLPVAFLPLVFLSVPNVFFVVPLLHMVDFLIIIECSILLSSFPILKKLLDSSSQNCGTAQFFNIQCDYFQCFNYGPSQ